MVESKKKGKEEDGGNLIQRQSGDPRAVAKQQIFAETVHAEVKHLHKNRTADFSINPANVHYITEKPNYVTPLAPSQSKTLAQQKPVETQASDKVDRIFKLKAMERRIAATALHPRQKCKWQQTSSQEIGWIDKPLVPRGEQERRGFKISPITGYVEHYVLMNHVNPYHHSIHKTR